MTRRRMAALDDLDDIDALRAGAPDVLSIALALAFLAIAVVAPHLLLLAGLVVLVTSLLRPAIHALLESGPGVVALILLLWGVVRDQDPWRSLQQICVGGFLGAIMALAGSRWFDPHH
tara:strand:- start:1156 stop:1509 length:354 start_codon:yes stop_codon:yes gene_type:complete